MTLQTSGRISLGNINDEEGASHTAGISLGNGAGRGMLGIPTGTVKLSDYYNKTFRAVKRLSLSGSYNPPVNLFSWATQLARVPGKTDFILTVSTGSTLNAALYGNGFAIDTGTGWTAGDTITIYNYGTITGRGGSGALAGYSNSVKNAPQSGQPGEAGIKFQWPTTVYNYGIIGGGGGGGGATYPVIQVNYNSNVGYIYYVGVNGGGGGGGGNCYSNFSGYAFGDSAQPGGPTAGGDGQYFTNISPYAGQFGSAAWGHGGAAGVSGGSGASQPNEGYPWPGAGGGGGLGASGGSGGSAASYPGYLVGGPGSAGGAGGAATIGANTYATWAVTGTRYGTIG